MAEYIEREALQKRLEMHQATNPATIGKKQFQEGYYLGLSEAEIMIAQAPKADVTQVRRGKLYSAHEVAEILAEAIGDKCACNVNGNDEWLPEKCELLDACPNPVGVACWEQWLKWKDGGADNGERDL